MHEIYRFKRHLRVEPLDEERTFLLGENERFLLQGRIHALTAPLVDGRRTVGEVIAALDGRVSPPEVLYAFMLLEQRGYIVEDAGALSPEVAGFWESAGVDAAHAAKRLAATPVAIRALEGADDRALTEALVAAGIHVHEDADVLVARTHDYLDDDFMVMARESRRLGKRWMPVKTSGVACWVGPMFAPGDGPCFACLAARLRSNRPVEAYLERRRGGARVVPPRVGLPATERLGLDFAALTLSRWIVGGHRGTIDRKLLSLDARDLRVEEHTVSRRPQCGFCGDPGLVSRRAASPVVLESRPKRFTADGGHRCTTPEETLARNAHLVSPITGVLSDLRFVGGEDTLRQIYTTIFKVCPAHSAPSFEDFHRISSGKGRTAAQARAGALCEAIERYSACFQGDEPRRRARLSDLGEDGIHPNDLQNFSETQYRSRGALGARVEPWRAIPLPYDADAVTDWTPVWSLTHERVRYVPSAYCYLAMPLAQEEQFCHFNSNGNAAGNCLEEAIVQGFFELVERDAVAVWWYNRLRRPRVELEAFGEPYFSELRRHYQDMGMRLWVLDITHDLSIPVFTAVAWDPDTGRHWTGCGAHFDARLAVQRALTEVNQCFDPRDRTRSPWASASLGDFSHLTPDDAAAARTPTDFPSVRHDDLLADVRACMERVRRAGLEMLVLDQTRPDVGLSAVKVIVPGLRHFWLRFGPGRLYDVPVRMGWRIAPSEETELNPVPFYF